MKKQAVIVLVILAVVAGCAAAAIALLPRLASSPETPAETSEEQPAVRDNEAEAEEETATDEDAAKEEAAEPEVHEAPAKAVTMAEAPVFTSTTEDGITVTAPEAFLETEEFAAIERELATLKSDGNSVCVVMIDLETRRGVSYNADQIMYPASCIKAAYCIYLYETYGSAGGSTPLVENVLVNSNNDDYNEVAIAFGFSPWVSWLKSHGASVTASGASAYNYPDTTAAELATIWEEIYRFGTSDEKGADVLTGFLSQTNNSPIAEELRGTYEVWSKAGWFPEDEYDLATTNDAGVVFADSGAYVMAIMTDIGSNLEALKPMINALDAAHDVMCGDEVAYYETTD